MPGIAVWLNHYQGALVSLHRTRAVTRGVVIYVTGAAIGLAAGVGSQAVAEGSSSRELLVRVDTALKLARERGHDRIETLEG